MQHLFLKGVTNRRKIHFHLKTPYFFPLSVKNKCCGKFVPVDKILFFFLLLELTEGGLLFFSFVVLFSGLRCFSLI